MQLMAEPGTRREGILKRPPDIIIGASGPSLGAKEEMSSTRIDRGLARPNES